MTNEDIEVKKFVEFTGEESPAEMAEKTYQILPEEEKAKTSPERLERLIRAIRENDGFDSIRATISHPIDLYNRCLVSDREETSNLIINTPNPKEKANDY